ncbi:hypothetical protein J8273_1936 [Carpediemonas membranifera]|uniref:Tyrosine-protein kinase ephrin type A/B receptor-like domain-containing protein n=1 Tax=Carpediemonas membranifera TaxID=201153 RepID=A0A8J6B9B2_9EUKA|nr:hypothetical protein J8273_1936 [Carpediemonas membranifera]|eukprot:KAG9396889.1 hypothetical protein J8273_1936 [Carpediemonas membranifera]
MPKIVLETLLFFAVLSILYVEATCFTQNSEILRIGSPHTFSNMMWNNDALVLPITIQDDGYRHITSIIVAKASPSNSRRLQTAEYEMDGGALSSSGHWLALADSGGGSTVKLFHMDDLNSGDPSQTVECGTGPLRVAMNDGALVIGAPSHNKGSGMVCVYSTDSPSSTHWSLAATVAGKDHSMLGYAVSASPDTLVASEPGTGVLHLFDTATHSHRTSRAPMNAGSRLWTAGHLILYGTQTEVRTVDIAIVGQGTRFELPDTDALLIGDVTLCSSTEILLVGDPTWGDSGRILAYDANRGGLPVATIVFPLSGNERAGGALTCTHGTVYVATGSAVYITPAPSMLGDVTTTATVAADIVSAVTTNEVGTKDADDLAVLRTIGAIDLALAGPVIASSDLYISPSIVDSDMTLTILDSDFSTVATHTFTETATNASLALSDTLLAVGLFNQSSPAISTVLVSSWSPTDLSFDHVLSSGVDGDGFGSAVAIDDIGNIIVAASLAADPSGLPSSGVVYVYSSNDWTLIQTISCPSAVGSSTSAGEAFGAAIATAEGMLLVGMPSYDSKRGLVAFYKLSSSTGKYEYVKTFSPSRRGEGFGASLAIDAGVFYVGAPYSTRQPRAADATADGVTPIGRVIAFTPTTWKAAVDSIYFNPRTTTTQFGMAIDVSNSVLTVLSSDSYYAYTPGTTPMLLASATIPATSAAFTVDGLAIAAANCTIFQLRAACPASTYSMDAVSCPTCPEGTYTASADEKVCAPAAAGSWATAGHLAECAAGTYQPTSGMASCITATAGYYAAGPGATAQIACETGHYSGAGQGACDAADPGYHVPATDRTKQRQCDDGKYQPAPAMDVCLNATAGHYVPADSKPHTAQESCQPGTYQEYAQRPSCIPAEPGFFVPGAGSSIQTPCEAGAYQNESGQTSCVPSDAGWRASTDRTAQLVCAAGSYGPEAGRDTCLTCDIGYYVPDDAEPHMTQLECAAGSFQNETGQATCINAEPGHYVALTAQHGQQACSAGTYQPLDGQTACVDVSAGYYAPDIASSTQLPCNDGYYQSDTRQTSCQQCPSNYGTPEGLLGFTACTQIVPTSSTLDSTSPAAITVSTNATKTRVTAATFNNAACELVTDDSGQTLVVPVVSSSTVAAGNYTAVVSMSDGTTQTLTVRISGNYTISDPTTTLEGPRLTAATTSAICPAAMTMTGLGPKQLTSAAYRNAHITCISQEAVTASVVEERLSPSANITSDSEVCVYLAGGSVSITSTDDLSVLVNGVEAEAYISGTALCVQPSSAFASADSDSDSDSDSEFAVTARLGGTAFLTTTLSLAPDPSNDTGMLIAVVQSILGVAAASAFIVGIFIAVLVTVLLVLIYYAGFRLLHWYGKESKSSRQVCFSSHIEIMSARQRKGRKGSADSIHSQSSTTSTTTSDYSVSTRGLIRLDSVKLYPVIEVTQETMSNLTAQSVASLHEYSSDSVSMDDLSSY